MSDPPRDSRLVASADSDRGLFAALAGDGTPLLFFVGLCLLMAGGFALFHSATGHFLPHDVAFLGMLPEELCAINECRIVHFMIHDRVAFGGALVAIGTLYLWLASFPLRAGEAWAWRLFAVTGALGFGSFLAYLNYGYLDTWHGVATLFLLPVYMAGMAISRRGLVDPSEPWRRSLRRDDFVWKSRAGAGRACLLVAAFGMGVGGLTVMTVGMSVVFVPQDLDFMGLAVEEIVAINPRLLPLIAHDRAGFGGAVATTGVAIGWCVWRAPMTRSLWQALLLSGGAGFGTAILVHPAIGYTDIVHLGPAYLGALTYAAGLWLSRPRR